MVEQLSKPQQQAVRLLKASLDYFNSYDGTGLFAGTGRYAILEGRVGICAAQARDLVHFWALLLRRMQWPVPPKSADGVILPLLEGDTEVLRVLANETASVVMIARALHSADKETRKKIEQDDDEVFEKPIKEGQLW